MDCPHCTKSIHVNWRQTGLGTDHELKLVARYTECPACNRVIVKLRKQGMEEFQPGHFGPIEGDVGEVFVHPRAPSRAPIHASVPDDLAADYREACLVLADSPKASAALSRRCLQHLLRETAGIKKRNLDEEIEEAMKQLPAHLADAIDGVRVVGNFAAHPIKSQGTGEVVEVEAGEAEWNLDTLEGLFDHYFTQPALLEVKRAALNAKLAEAGKPELKSATPPGLPASD